MKLLGLIFVIFLSVEFIGINLNLGNISTKTDQKIIPEIAPTSQAHQFDENNYSFNSTEIISRNFGWSNLTTSNIEYEVPSQYNFTQANITITVTNSTIKEEIIDGDDENGSRSIEEQAQSFEISEDSYLVNLSVYFGDKRKNEFTPNLEIRNNTHNGSVIHSFSHIFSGDLWEEWVNISFDPYLYLKSGSYYLWMDNGYTFSKVWWTGQDNDTDTWYVSGGDWTPANFDLTLKVYTSNIVTPEDVNLRVENIPVLNDGDTGIGYTNFAGTINNSTISLNVTVDSGISYKYSVNSTCYRNYSSIANFTINDDIVNWNLSLDLIDPGSEYTGYSAQISGFRFDHYNITAYNGILSVAVNRIDDQNIKLLEVVDTITFMGQNYVSSMNIDTQVFIGDLISINGTVLDEGNVTVVIEAINETIIYQNSSIFTGTYSFLWYIDPSIPYGNYSATAFYMGEGEVGNKRINFTVLNKASMSCGDVTGYSFDNLSISCNYIDTFTDLSIEDASINYSILGITGDMVYGIEEEENYTGILDLKENLILPGSYLGICSVIKEGYSPIVTNFNLNILPRNISIIITNNVSTVFHGENLGINISIVDNHDGGIVKIPINLELKIIKDSDEDAEYIVLVENLTGISQSANFSWTIHSNLDVGQYKIMVTSISDYYEGSNTLNDAFTLYNKAYMKCTDVTAFVFETITLECRYYDVNTNQPIENASINYKILDIEGSMEFESDGSANYSKILDLDFYAFRSGTYPISCLAIKEGYPLFSSNFNLIINPRELILDLSISSSSVFPGERIKFGISLKDQLDNNTLKRPLNVEIKIVRNSNGVTEEIVFLGNQSGVSSHADFIWEIPLNFERGKFDIIISAQNDYYTGIFVHSNSIEVKFIVWWVYLIIALGSLTAMGGTFIFTQRLRTRHSVKGIILLHNSGIPIAQEMIHGTLKYNPILFSGAISGVIALIKEITGQKLHTMEIEGGFLNILKGEDSLLVVVLQKNPFWIKGIMQKCFDEILNDHGSEIEDFKGATFEIELNNYVKSFFGVSLLAEDNKTENKLERNPEEVDL